MKYNIGPMSNAVKRLSENLKQQAELFLLDAGEFFPFGSYIDKSDSLITCSGYIESENDHPDSLKLIMILEDYFIKKIANGEILIGAIAIDVVLNEGAIKRDGIQIRFFENEIRYTHTLKYIVNNSSVDFYES